MGLCLCAFPVMGYEKDFSFFLPCVGGSLIGLCILWEIGFCKSKLLMAKKERPRPEKLSVYLYIPNIVGGSFDNSSASFFF